MYTEGASRLLMVGSESVRERYRWVVLYRGIEVALGPANRLWRAGSLAPPSSVRVVGYSEVIHFGSCRQSSAVTKRLVAPAKHSLDSTVLVPPAEAVR